VRERPNRHDWKSCVLHGTVGSNPTSSATSALGRATPFRPGGRWPAISMILRWRSSRHVDDAVDAGSV
jgi:hypothetical protein